MVGVATSRHHLAMAIVHLTTSVVELNGVPTPSARILLTERRFAVNPGISCTPLACHTKLTTSALRLKVCIATNTMSIVPPFTAIILPFAFSICQNSPLSSNAVSIFSHATRADYASSMWT